MGMCAILWLPSGDLYRHSMTYFQLKDMNYNDFLIFQALNLDIVLYSITFAFAKLGINFEIVRFLFVFISYQCVFWIYQDVAQHNEILKNNQYYYKLGFVLMFMSVAFFNITHGLRYGLAIYISAAGVYKLFWKGQKTGWFFMFFAGLVHFSTFIFIAPCVMSFLKRTINKRSIAYLSIAILILGAPAINNILELLPLPELLSNRTSQYTAGYWAQEFFEDHSFKYRISKFLSYWSIFPLMMISYKNISRKTSVLTDKMLLLMIPLLAVAYPFGEIMPRFSYFLIIIYVCSCLTYVNVFIKNKWNLRIVYFFTILTFIANIYTFRRELSLSSEYKLLYSPLPTILFYTYSESHINQLIDETGSYM